jgi:hypothetical protein
MPKKSTPIILIIIVLAAVGGYAALTYPKTTVNIPVSFKIGAESKTVEFDVPPLHEKYYVEVKVTNGNALWNAKLLSGSTTMWSHSASQGSQTSYQSGWQIIEPGHYVFTFSTIGFGSLDGTVTLQTKGGLW